MQPDLVIFDLDGTLIDTAPDLIDSLNHTIAIRGLAPLTFGDLTHLVGHGARAMIERAFRHRAVELDPDEIPGLQHVFIDHYRAGMPGKSQPYPGLVAALERLAADDIRLAVCTNKMESLARDLISGLGMTDHFAAITGGDTFPVRKPDAGHILGTIAMAGGKPQRSIMIGDSVNDMLAARNAGIASIAVPFGYSDVPVQTLGPSHVINHFDELNSGLVKQLMAASGD